MNLKALGGALSAVILCAAAGANAQGTGTAAGATATTGSAATSSDQASSAGKGTASKRGAASKGSSSEKSSGAMASPSGGTANSTDSTPGTYDQSGKAAPRTPDPMQTKSARDGSAMPSATPRAANAASANKK